MSLTLFQRSVCRLLAADHIARGERDVAGGVALNEILHAFIFTGLPQNLWVLDADSYPIRGIC